LIILPIIFWACAFPFINILLKELSFINLTIMRFVVVCFVLIIFLSFQSKRFNPLQKKDIIPIFLLGFFGVIGYHLGLNYGEQYVSPGAASLIIATIPIFVAILSIIYLEEKITIKKTSGIIISLTGVTIISLWGTSDAVIEIDYIYGAIGVLIAALMGALYTIAGKKMLKRYNGFSLTVYAMLLGSIGLIPFLNISLINQVKNLSITGWGALIFLGLFSTITAYTLWYIALETRDASEISMYLYAIPVISTIISYFLVGEIITIYFILGGLFVITGLLLVNSKKSPKNLPLLKSKRKDS
jgi:drug/metabolite transporter (DMT)-like permease